MTFISVYQDTLTKKRRLHGILVNDSKQGNCLNMFASDKIPLESVAAAKASSPTFYCSSLIQAVAGMHVFGGFEADP
ncbi:unnamed protein product [Larinioides sclopetarius]|uniref:Uncharacterized protein n=1 Tax=Larinioides sclopetarius TaxID=280406 RepID=A0AAV2A575_9ARAC